MIRRRRLRASENLRALVRETSVSASDLIYPVFVIEGKDIKNPIDSMPVAAAIYILMPTETLTLVYLSIIQILIFVKKHYYRHSALLC